LIYGLGAEVRAILIVLLGAAKYFGALQHYLALFVGKISNFAYFAFMAQDSVHYTVTIILNAPSLSQHFFLVFFTSFDLFALNKSATVSQKTFFLSW
jgi:hypothetical protein